MREILNSLLSATLRNTDVIPGASEQRAVAHVSARVCGHVTPRTDFRWQDTACDVTESGGRAVDVASTTAVGTTTTNNDDNNDVIETLSARRFFPSDADMITRSKSAISL